MITSLSIGTGGLGRFGNQMFTIAGCIGIATKSGQPFAFPRWKNYDNALFGGPIDDMNAFFVNQLPEIIGSMSFNEYPYFWGYRDIKLPTGNWNIHAHLQSPKFFEHCMPLIRHYFRMKDEYEQNDYVAVHWRAGDYLENLDAYHPRQPIEYYQKAFDYFPDGTVFKIFSDDIDKAKEMFLAPFAIRKSCTLRFVDKEVDYLDSFKKMKCCKSYVIANSSFSAMAALLGEHPEKKVISPRLWFGKQANGLPADDIYDKNWVVI